MALIPALSDAARRLRDRLTIPKPIDEELSVSPPHESGHAIVVGIGRVGEVVCDMLGRNSVTYLAVDNHGPTVVHQRRQSREAYFGDVRSPAFLARCGLQDAAAVIVTIYTQSAIDDIVAQVRKIRSDIPIIARARDAEHARHLYAIGVTDAVPETIEASLQLSEAALVGLGLPAGPVIASIHEKRDEFRRDLASAADAAGREGTRSIRAKTLRR